MSHKASAFPIPGKIDTLPAEQAIIGAILTNGIKTLRYIDEILRPEYFCDPFLGDIYRESVRVSDAGRVVDAFTLKRFIVTHSALSSLTAEQKSQYVSDLVNAMVSTGEYCTDYAVSIRDGWIRRELQKSCIAIAQECALPRDLSGNDIIERLEEDLLNISQKTADTASNITLHDALCTTLTGTAEAMQRGDSLAGLSWGYPSIDRLTNGLVDGNLYLIGARPGMGKTGLALSIALRLASHARRVLFWSGEMTETQLAARAVSGKTGIGLRSVLSGRDWEQSDGQRPLTRQQWTALQNATDATCHLPLEFDTRTAITVSQLRSRGRRMKRSRQGLNVIILDYIGLMAASPEASKAGLYPSMTEISKGLKSLAKELSVPIIALAQLNRQVESRPDRRPMISDLRDSGGLEQDADVIGLLYREEYYLRKDMQRAATSDQGRSIEEMDEKLTACSGKAQLHIAKNRHGPEGAVELAFNAATTWFKDRGERASSDPWTGEAP